MNLEQFTRCGETLYHLTIDSDNGKTDCPTSTTSGDTCFDECGMYKLCYGKGNPFGLGGHWKKLCSGERGYTFKEFLARIRALKVRTKTRHNQAGDLPGKNGNIDQPKLCRLQKAFQHLIGWTYTHKPVNLETKQGRRNAGIINFINRHTSGFTINLSADNLVMADHLAELGIGPVVTVVPSHQKTNVRTPAGRLVVICPSDHVTGLQRGITCARCKAPDGNNLCSWKDRKVIIGFPAHGNHRKQIDATFVQIQGAQ